MTETFVKNVALYFSLLRKILLILLKDITVTSRTIRLRSVPRFSTQHLICSFTLYPYSLCVFFVQSGEQVRPSKPISADTENLPLLQCFPIVPSEVSQSLLNASQ